MLKTDPHLAFVFPGQGSQHLGMMRSFWDNFPEIHILYEEASSIINLDLWKLSQEGPESLLNQTQYTQPALLVASISAWKVWQNVQEIEPIIVAGHSLGEYSALVASGALTFADAIKLVHLRGQFMQQAVGLEEGAMAAVLGVELSDIENACREAAGNQIVQAANLNSLEQTVIAGDRGAVLRAMDILKSKGAKRIILLPVSVPSHCALMIPAAEKLKIALADIPFKKPRITLLHNVDANFHNDPAEISSLLQEQLFKPVQWVKTVHHMFERNVNRVVECGPGKVLSGLIKKIHKEIEVLPISSMELLAS